MKHILIIASYGPSITNFRLNLIKKLLTKGYKVSVASPMRNFSSDLQKQLIDLGIKINFFSLNNTSLNFIKDCKSIFEIFRIIRVTSPNIIISYTAKPVIYTGLILKFFKKIKYYPLITGLGYAFINSSSIKKKIIKYFMVKLYRAGLKASNKVIFQNIDDRLLFLNLDIIEKESKSAVVNGSGVDLDEYPLSKLPAKPIFLMISRLLIDKGVREYVEAAKIVLSQFSKVKFKLVGYLDQNPSSISLKELNSWIKDGTIEYYNQIKSVKSILKSCRYYVLPSYREGTPRSTLEALATGRPIITTDTPGCRETVMHKKNGLLVPIKDSVALANAMIELLNHKDEEIQKMAKKSFLMARNKFEINKVNNSMFSIMKL